MKSYTPLSSLFNQNLKIVRGLIGDLHQRLTDAGTLDSREIHSGSV